MKELNISIEINGEQVHAGQITGTASYDAFFTYSDEYIEKGYPALSISLPTSTKIFDAKKTQNYFEGLLPEGFARKSVSEWIHANEDDYLSILEVLGSECLGAIKVSGDTSAKSGYVKLDEDEVKALAKEGVSKSTELITETHLSLTGASGKVGLYYDTETNTWYKPMGEAPSTHIVKQSHVRLANIVTNEQLSLLTAEKLGIDIPESFILDIGNAKDEDVLFVTRRYDRCFGEDNQYIDGIKCPYRLHQEDFAQALGIASSDKYEKGDANYMKRIFDLLRANAADPITDQLKLWNLLVYDFLVGNTDNHIKNISLLYSPDLKTVSLAPAYDIVSICVFENSSLEMAIGIGGERHLHKLTAESFKRAATDASLAERLAMRRFYTMAEGFEKALTEAAKELNHKGFENANEIKEKILKRGGFGNL